jgi:hypothetical protein
MEIIKLNVEYATQALGEIPIGYIDKTVCGCGMTSVALENSLDTILLVPNIELATNKAAQYPNGRSNNTLLPVWGSTTNEDINNYVNSVEVLKIVCVYDSLRKVEHLLERCRLIIDESQELLTLSRHPERARSISYVFETARYFTHSLSFLSSTPTPLEYLPSWVSDMTQTKYIWTNSRKAVPILYKHNQPFRALKHDILTPLNERQTVTISGKTFGKVIVFMNTVEQIARIISDVGIAKSDCAVICGDSIRNELKIKGIARLTDPKNLPVFTFVTASGFKGIDLYDKEAMTVVVSYTGKKWQMVDILTDLKQAVSRQRDKTNLNYGSYIYIYNQSEFEKTEDQLLEKLDQVRHKVENAVRLWDYAKTNDLLNGWTSDRDIQAYTHFVDGKLEMNEMAFSADRYFILELRRQFTKGFDISVNFDEATNVEARKLPMDITYAQMANYFNVNHTGGQIDWGPFSHKADWINIIESCYKLYGKAWENISYSRNMISYYGNSFAQLQVKVMGKLKEGNTYSRKHVVNALSKAYTQAGLKKKARYNDLYQFCNFTEKRTRYERFISITKFHPI